MNDHLTEAVARMVELASWLDDTSFRQRPEKDAAALRLLLSALRDVPEGWRPIDSAPKDGTHVLTWSPGDSRARLNWTEASGQASHWMNSLMKRAPTFWQPLPEPPLLSETGGTDGGG